MPLQGCRKEVVAAVNADPGPTLAQIGRVHGVTQERVRQILAEEGLERNAQRIRRLRRAARKGKEARAERSGKRKAG